MNDVTYSSNAIRVQLDPDVLHDLVYGDGPDGDEHYQRSCALREHQIYRLLRSVVSQFNGRMKGRRERLKLVEEGDGLVLEFSA